MSLQRFFYRFFTGLLLLWTSLSVQAAPQKFALVIGNANYALSPLKNPVNDANDMAAKLKSRGFRVITLLDADKRKMKQAIRTFTRQLKEGSVGLFYYAGHGLEVNGNNYLVPIGADIETEADVEYESINAGRVLDSMGNAENSLNMVILDACRNNPYASSFRSTSRGLAKMTAPTGSLLMYATKPGDVAADGNGRNGIFTENLLTTLDEKGLTAEQVFKRTAARVYKATGKRQSPYIEGVIFGDFYFWPDEPDSAAEASRVTAETESPVTESKQILKDKYLLFLDKGLLNKNLPRVDKYFQKLESMNAVLPAATVYRLADFYYAKDRLKQALSLFDRYLQREGPKAEHYRESLEKVVDIEARLEDETLPASSEVVATNTRIKTVQNSQGKNISIEMKTIPAGSVLRGTGVRKIVYGLEGMLNQKESHRIEVSAFEMGKYEVTQAQWQAIMRQNPSRFSDCPACPVEQVSWLDIQKFIEKLNQLTGKSYRLPSESEWEYACRGGSDNVLYCGEASGGSDVLAWDEAEDPVNDLGWHRYNAGQKTHPVGQKQANAFGLHDMSGNVWEWVQDCWNKNNNGRPGDGSALETGNCKKRVLRGGSWLNNPKYLRADRRSGSSVSSRSANDGFRLARSITP